MRALALNRPVCGCLAALVLLAAGCAPIPELGPPDAQTEAAPWPALIPQAEITAAAAPGAARPEDVAPLQARAAALQGRAAALRARQPGA